jgi:hypothetical protein
VRSRQQIDARRSGAPDVQQQRTPPGAQRPGFWRTRPCLHSLLAAQPAIHHSWDGVFPAVLPTSVGRVGRGLRAPAQPCLTGGASHRCCSRVLSQGLSAPKRARRGLPNAQIVCFPQPKQALNNTEMARGSDWLTD